MNKRLIWNFEINPEQDLDLPTPLNTSPDYHWEARFFWPESAIILINGLNERFLRLEQYQIKSKHDLYFLLPEADYNIKLRREKLVYKPLLERTSSALAFGKKIKLDEDAPSTLPAKENSTIDPRALLQQLHNQARKVTVEKEVLIYRFPAPLKTKLELARLLIKEQVFYSLGLESSALNVVEALSEQLIREEETSDYISFLKKVCPC